MYATYDYYEGTYGGNTIPPERFNFFAREASVFIDYITFNRVKKLDEITDEIKNATCAVADCMHSLTNGSGIDDGRQKSSESVGDYSVTYAGTSSTNANSSKSVYHSVAKGYLIHTGLMYKGVY